MDFKSLHLSSKQSCYSTLKLEMSPWLASQPSDNACESPPACVTKKTSADLTEGEIKEYIGKCLAKYTQLGGVVFVDALPKSTSGKIIKRILREDMEKKRENQAKPNYEIPPTAWARQSGLIPKIRI